MKAVTTRPGAARAERRKLELERDEAHRLYLSRRDGYNEIMLVRADQALEEHRRLHPEIP